MVKWLFRLFFLLILVAGGWLTWVYFTTEESIETRTVQIDLGPLSRTVTATGHLAPTTEVLVGCEISGTIGEVLVEHNDHVTKGQVICKLKSELLEADFKQAEADLARATATVTQAQVQEKEAYRQYEWTEGVAAEGGAPPEEVQIKKAAWEAAEASTKAALAAQEGAQARVDLTTSRLEKAVITSPIDGIVLDRKVDVGQTVAATLMAPEMFVLAEDLSRMELLADVSEADVGYVCPGQAAMFTVNAYRDKAFKGRVRQVRNKPRMVGSVVTYTVVVEVENESMLLRPGMPADIDIEIVRTDRIVRIPNVALRFRPPLPPDEIRTMLDELEWPAPPTPIEVAALAQPHATTKPGELQIAPPPIEPNKATLWQFDGGLWSPVPVWTLYTDSRQTALGESPRVTEGTEFVTEVREGRQSFKDRIQQAVLMTRPENRRL